MRKYDMHLHKNFIGGDPSDLVSKLEQSGFYGSNVISLSPKESPIVNESVDFAKRLSDLLAYTGKYPDRLFPVLWVHPDEDAIEEKIAEAAEKGVRAFKMICSNYYIYEDKGMKVLHAIAKSGKPVMFHSGILWDGRPSSNYNRPANWECCLEVPKLRFSLAHCSWPWYDECIAVYGKFLSAYALRPDLSSEMFLDLTPGTPEPYRRDLLTKLHTVGYDIKHNLLFGTDCNAENYNVEWNKRWVAIDNAIYADLKLDEDTLECIYSRNFLRFMGLSDETVTLKPKFSDQI